jgi:starvation-inducible DNA-binding protein
MPQIAEKATANTVRTLSGEAVSQITNSLRLLLADVFTLYMKTKNFHWHMTGRHFRDYHLLLDEHAEQIFAMSDDVAERARKIGGTTLRSIADIARTQRIKDNNEDHLTAHEMLEKLRDDNVSFTRFLRETHELCERNNDVATGSMIEVWIDQTERRTWFLSEIVNEL